jgi:DNA transformation protein
MFGKTGLFCQGVMFAVVADDVMYVPDDDDREAFAEAAGAGLSYMKGGGRSRWRSGRCRIG